MTPSASHSLPTRCSPKLANFPGDVSPVSPVYEFRLTFPRGRSRHHPGRTESLRGAPTKPVNPFWGGALSGGLLAAGAAAMAAWLGLR